MGTSAAFSNLNQERTRHLRESVKPLQVCAGRAQAIHKICKYMIDEIKMMMHLFETARTAISTYRRCQSSTNTKERQPAAQLGLS